MTEITYISSEGLEKLKKELSQLKTKDRAEIARQIAEARDKGDLSENAEYDAAKDAQGMLEMKIAKLENAIAHARIIDSTKMDASKVTVLSTVKIRNLNTQKEISYQLVSEKEADLKIGKISASSPIGKGLLGKVKGDIADIQTPGGSIKFEIISISI